jgi:hypothetical protein
MSQILVTGEAKVRDIQGPVVANSGVITALDGDASQYVRGDGTLADFPTSTGGGSSVSYYLNSSVSQGTIGGVAYRQLGKTPIAGAGTDITISANGYIASYITDANDPALLEVPAGNFNCEFYFSVNSNAHNPFVYAEVYKYDGTTFTLIGSSQSVPEYLTNGTTLSPYYFAIPVAQTVLAITDRIAIRIYVNVDGRTVTLHTENNHLCQVVTTFSKGLTSLNNLTRQVQFFGTGTDGTDFNISSVTATHTFNLPVASATNTGKLSSTDWSTFNGKVPYTGATASVNLGTFALNAGAITTEAGYAFKILAAGTLFQNGYSVMSSLEGNISLTQAISAGNLKAFTFDFSSWATNTSRTYTLPNLSGTLALLEGSQTFSGMKTFTNTAIFEGSFGIGLKYGASLSKGFNPPTFSSLAVSVYSDATTNNIVFRDDLSKAKLIFNNSDQTYTFPASSGTIALTSNLSAYVPYSGATANVNLGLFGLTSRGLTISKAGSSVNGLIFEQAAGLGIDGAGFTTIGPVGTDKFGFYFGGATQAFVFNASGITTQRAYSMPDATGTLALLSGTQTFTGATTFSLDLLVNGVRVGIGSGGVNNARFGALSFMSNTTGSYNTAIGTNSLNANTTGSSNTALGNGSLQQNTTGDANTAIGLNSLVNNTSGQSNVAIGLSALGVNTTGASNVAVGSSALLSNTTAINNTAIGNAALSLNTTGTGNTAIGQSAGFSITTGSNNTIIGAYAGTAAMSNNIVLADGAGNIRYQWNGTNNVFGNPISGTSATFSGALGANGVMSLGDDGTYGATYKTLGLTGNSNGSHRIFAGTADNMYIAAATGRGIYLCTNGTVTPQLTITSTGAATFSSSIDVATTARFHSSSNWMQFQQNVLTSQNTDGAHIRSVVSADSAPTYSWTGDTDTGMYTPSANTIAFTTGGSERMRITSGGNVGIGTSSPSDRLYVTSSAFNVATFNSTFGQMSISFANNGTTFASIGSGNSVTSSGAAADDLGLGTNGLNKNIVFATGTGYSERMRITSGGNVLIGTTTDNGSKLQVNGGLTTSAYSYLYGLRISGNDTGNTIYAGNASMGITAESGNTIFIGQSNGTTGLRVFTSSGGVTISGSLSKGSGSFRIDHPLESMTETHQLVHSFVESPQANNIYRGKIQLENGVAQVNLDNVSTMTEGTFVILNREIHTYTSNETDWDAVRGKVEGNILTIESQNNQSNAIVSWLVIGERQDKHIMETDWTDDNGKVIVEPLKEIEIIEQNLKQK